MLAFESEAAALDVLTENRRRFLCGNLPDRAGIGAGYTAACGFSGWKTGSGIHRRQPGRLSSIIMEVLERNPHCLIAVHAVTMETEHAILKIAEQLSESHRLELQTLSASELRPLGNYHMHFAQNPVTLAVFRPFGFEK